MTKKVVILPGDGVGPEVAAGAVTVLTAAADAHALDLETEFFDFGGAAIDAHGAPLPEATLAACRGSDAILLGAVGGPKWDGGGPRPEAGLLALRKALGVFANLRPVKMYAGLEPLSPLRIDDAAAVDILFVRELTGGVYFGDREEGGERARDVCDYAREEVARVARVAFRAAAGRRGAVTSVDKANVLATSRLWRKTVEAVRTDEFPDATLVHQLVDSMAMKLITAPAAFDVVLTENMFGDILSDEASVIPGSIGLAPSASLGEGGPGLYEPIHGSAPDIAGENIANPIGAILSAAMMFRHSLNAPEAAAAIETAVEGALRNGLRTRDLGGDASCSDAAKAIASKI
ncbi:MAG: 3-isopropylmalate dehydrogenase [Pseudomonadota bacterium]